MTKTYTYTFDRPVKKPGTDGRHESDWTLEKVTLTKRVTDKMEERPQHKAAYASNYFNQVLREQHGYKRSVVTAYKLKEITK